MYINPEAATKQPLKTEQQKHLLFDVKPNQLSTVFAVGDQWSTWASTGFQTPTMGRFWKSPFLKIRTCSWFMVPKISTNMNKYLISIYLPWNNSHLKITGWNMKFPFGTPAYVQGVLLFSRSSNNSSLLQRFSSPFFISKSQKKHIHPDFSTERWRTLGISLEFFQQLPQPQIAVVKPPPFPGKTHRWRKSWGQKNPPSRGGGSK